MPFILLFQVCKFHRVIYGTGYIIIMPKTTILKYLTEAVFNNACTYSLFHYMYNNTLHVLLKIIVLWNTSGIYKFKKIEK